MSSVGHELLNVPFDDMVTELATAIAKSQLKLDLSSITIAKIMGDVEKAPVYLPNIQLDGSGNLLSDDDEESNIKTSMIGAGFQPKFYQFTDTIIEVKMAISMQRETEFEKSWEGKETRVSWGGRGLRIYSAPINATYSNSYSYHVEGSSLIRTKIAPVPPNTFMQKMLDMKAEAIRLTFEAKMKEWEAELEARTAAADK